MMKFETKSILKWDDGELVEAIDEYLNEVDSHGHPLRLGRMRSITVTSYLGGFIAFITCVKP